MKHKFLAIFMILATVGSAVYAQETEEKKHRNYFVGGGIGVMTVFNDGLNSPTLNINLQFGKLITPTWGFRGEVGFAWQSLEEQQTGYSRYCKKFGELNLDAMINLNSLFGNKNPNRAVDVYLFGGPTINISSAVSGTISYTSSTSSSSATNSYTEDGTTVDYTTTTTTTSYSQSQTFEHNGAKLRVGATIGLGALYNINSYWALGLEARYGVTPSIFGQGSDCRKAEGTGRLTATLLYTIGGKSFKPCKPAIDQEAINAEVNKYREEAERARLDADRARQQKPEIREVTKEVKVATAFPVFFKIGSAVIDDYGKVQIKLAAKTLKESNGKVYKVQAYCDKGTGSVETNQKLSDARAKAVYDALVAEGVPASSLEIVSNGGVDNMFLDNPKLSRVVITE